MNHLRARASTAGTHVALSPQPDRRVKAITRALGLIILITTKPWRKWVTPYVTSYFVKQDGMSNSSLLKEILGAISKDWLQTASAARLGPALIKKQYPDQSHRLKRSKRVCHKARLQGKMVSKETKTHWLGFENATCEKSSNVWVKGSIWGGGGR